jgi:hypothetical protein
MRWGLVPFLLPLLVAVNWSLVSGRSIYRAMLLAQLVFYSAAAAGWWARRHPLGRLRILSLPFFFSAANAAALVGCARLVTGRQTVLWKRTRP